MNAARERKQRAETPGERKRRLRTEELDSARRIVDHREEYPVLPKFQPVAVAGVNAFPQYPDCMLCLDTGTDRYTGKPCGCKLPPEIQPERVGKVSLIVAWAERELTYAEGRAL